MSKKTRDRIAYQLTIRTQKGTHIHVAHDIPEELKRGVVLQLLKSGLHAATDYGIPFPGALPLSYRAIIADWIMRGDQEPGPGQFRAARSGMYDCTFTTGDAQ